MSIRTYHAVACALVAATLLAGCGTGDAPAGETPDTTMIAPDTAPTGSADGNAAGAPGPTAGSAAAGGAAAGAAGGPTAGRYVCRQYTTTMGYLTIGPGGTYETAGVQRRYSWDPATGAIDWQGGSYDDWGWEGSFEHVQRPAGDGRPDEDIIRLEGDGLQIACYRMADG